jgi:hypothetical protein
VLGRVFDLYVAPAQIEASIPESINLGAFTVTCTKVSRTLISKHQRLHDQLMELMARKTIESANTVVERFKTIQHRLNRLPNNVEELTELREFIGTLPTQLNDIKGGLNQVLANFGVVESVQFKLDRGALFLKWEVFGWPKDILEKAGGDVVHACMHSWVSAQVVWLTSCACLQVAEVDEELARRKREYQLNMEEEQEGFVERVKSLRTVSRRSQTAAWTNMTRVEA